MPHLSGEMRMWVWGMRISKEDLTSPVRDDRISRVWVPRLSGEMRHLPREMWLHLQNLGLCDTTPIESVFFRVIF